MNVQTVLAAADRTVADASNPAQSKLQICAALRIVEPFLATLSVADDAPFFEKLAIRFAAPILREVAGHLCGRA